MRGKYFDILIIGLKVEKHSKISHTSDNLIRNEWKEVNAVDI